MRRPAARSVRDRDVAAAGVSRSALGRPAPPRITPELAPAVLQALAALQAQAGDAFEALFSDGDAVPRGRLPRGAIRVLKRARLVRRGVGPLRATVRLDVVDGRLLATDRPEREATDQVFPLMLEQAYTLALLDVPDGATVFEPCVGSGVLSIAAAARGGQVVATDISPRALAFARSNAALAGVSARVDLRQGSLVEPLGEHERFARVIVNPPFEPVPAGGHLPWHSAAGADGLDVLRALVPDLPRHMTVDGRLAIVTWVLGRDDVWGGLGPLLEQAFPGSRRAIAPLADDPVAVHARRFVGAKGYGAWLRLLEDQGLDRIRLVHATVDRAGPQGVEVVDAAPGLAAARRVLPRLRESGYGVT
ncbi:MAG: methyltransferase [Planctomycetota bacterium]